MIILKSETFGQESDVVKFVNLNNIKRENILEITATVVEPNLWRFRNQGNNPWFFWLVMPEGPKSFKK